MSTLEQEIRKAQRGMKDWHLVRFMNQFDPFRHRTEFAGCTRSIPTTCALTAAHEANHTPY
jgi:hypothetical protein